MWNRLAFAVLLSLFAVGYSEKCYFLHKITEGNNETYCVQMNVSSTVGVRYLASNNKYDFVKLALPCNATVSGTCINDTMTSLSMAWGTHNVSEAYNLTFYFMRYKNKEWSLTNISFEADTDSFRNESKADDEIVTAMVNKSKGVFGKVKNRNSYYCKSENNQSLTTQTGNKTHFTIHVSLKDFKVQAFGYKINETDYGSVSRCSQDIKGSKIVPIAVGAALAGLVIIVLIAYIIGRLRSHRQSSYEALS